jgi:hypothetical protein
MEEAVKEKKAVSFEDPWIFSFKLKDGSYGVHVVTTIRAYKSFVQSGVYKSDGPISKGGWERLSRRLRSDWAKRADPTR